MLPSFTKLEWTQGDERERERGVGQRRGRERERRGAAAGRAVESDNGGGVELTGSFLFLTLAAINGVW